jgi:hypothetical protein
MNENVYEHIENNCQTDWTKQKVNFHFVIKMISKIIFKFYKSKLNIKILT